jgi:hypothetical protein
MSADSDAIGSPAVARPAVTAIAGDAEFAMFEVLGFDGQELRVHTPFVLTVGELLPLQIERIGRTIARVTGHVRGGERELTLLRLIDDGDAA